MSQPSYQSPIIVVGPTTRCGTTLLQRLLNSTREIIIYGENFYMLQNVPQTIGGLHRHVETKQRIIKTTMHMLRNTNEDFEGSNLFPDMEEYLQAVRGSFHLLMRFYDQYSQKMDFPRWGLKHQVFGVRGFQFLQKLLPEARYVMIYRDLYPVTKSAKARWPSDYPDLDAYSQFGARWQRHIREMQSARAKHQLLFKYEDFIANPGPHIDRLESFIGTDQIDRSVMDRKINSNPRIDSADGLTVENTYVEPVELSESETQALFKNCVEFYRELGYSHQLAQPA